jgi:hypothetical protein
MAPYYISNTAPQCPNWAVVKEDKTVVACHDTKNQAIAQMVAISQAEKLPVGGDYNNK